MTLLEVIISVVIVGLISAVAFTVFSAAGESNATSAAESYALAVVSAQTSAAPINNGFSTDAATLGIRSSNAHVVDGIASREGEVSMAVSGDGALAVSAWAAPGICVQILLDSVSDTDFVPEVAEGFACDARPLLSSSS